LRLRKLAYIHAPEHARLAELYRYADIGCECPGRQPGPAGYGGEKLLHECASPRKQTA
jgi:hypothetical protein